VAAARAAVLVSGGLADLGGDTLRDAHAAITARAGEVLEQAIAAGADVADVTELVTELKHPERSPAG
jgi:hypothetical protein